MAQKTTLTQTDWIMAAFQALTKGGPQAVKAESLARGLGVSKGSFYWHFKNVKDLQGRMIDLWLEQATQGIIYQVNSANGSAADKLYALVEIVTSDQSDPYGGPLVESAIRNWGLFEPDVAAAVVQTDGQRIAYVSELFQEVGFSAALSVKKSKILYGALVGFDLICDRHSSEAYVLLCMTLDHLLAGKPPKCVEEV